MKIGVRSKSLVNIILLLFYIESYTCFTIYRTSRDESDSLDTHNCESIDGTFSVQAGRCKCEISSASIVSTNTGQIACVKNTDIGKSKYTRMLLYSVFSIYSRKIVTMLSFYFSSHQLVHYRVPNPSSYISSRKTLWGNV